MGVLLQSIDNLLNGVSQRPHEQRLSSQAQAQTNGLSSTARGLMKRPPVIHQAKLTSTITGWATAFIHKINRDETERYHVVIANGAIYVYDAITFTAVTVISPDGLSYLTDSGSYGFRAATAGDTTVIVNRGTTVRQGTDKFENRTYEALLYVRQADFGTTYSITLNGVPVTITTAPASTASTRTLISTSAIASDLYTAMISEPLIDDNFDLQLIGSSIYVTRADAADFRVSASDGLSDSGLKVIKGSLQNFADLPRKAIAGFTVEITSDPESDADNYWVRFDDHGSPDQEGTWKECPAPGTVINFDASTMPHRLVRYGHVLENVPHVSVAHVPPAFVVDVSAASASKDWDYITPGPVAIDPAVSRIELREHEAGLSLTTGAACNLIQFPYYLDTSLVEPGNDVTITAYINGVSKFSQTQPGGVSPTYINRPTDAEGNPIPWPPGFGPTLFGGGVVNISQAILNTDVLTLQMTYAKNETPDTHRQAYFSTDLSVPLTATPAKEIQFVTPPIGKLKLIPVDETYPVGTQITVTVDTVPFAYTVPTSPKTGAQVATALAALIDAHASFVAVAGSTAEAVKVTRTNNVAPDVDVSVVFNEAVTFFNPALAMVANEHAGRTLRNLTDGSSGTISSNTTESIVVAALTGGVDNTFQAGDIISVDGTGRYFVFERCPWDERAAGDLTNCPFPSFKDNRISDVVWYQNRLGFLSNENVVFSEVGKLYHFFRTSAAQLFDSDMIDVKAAQRDLALFHSFALWNEDLYGVSPNGLFLISGDPALAPSTIRIDLVASVPNTPGPLPFALGNRLYLTRGKDSFTQVQELSVQAGGDAANNTVNTVDITKDSPQYIAGIPLAAVGDDAMGVLAILTNYTGQKRLYVHSFHFGDEDKKRLQAAWSLWTFENGTIVGIDMIDGKLGILTVCTDGVFLSYINLNVAIDTTDADEGVQYLDRRVTQTTTGVTVAYSAITGRTTWTLPYETPIDDSLGVLKVYRRDTLAALTTLRPSATQISAAGDYHLTSVYIGVAYEFRYKFSRIYFRYEGDKPETQGRLQLHYFTIHYRDTTGFDLTVTPEARSAFTTSVALSAPAASELRVPIHCENKQTTIELVNSTPGPCCFTSADWEGYFTSRSKRV
jgi:hypothetical protein